MGKTTPAPSVTAKDLSRALKGGELRLAYQPKIDLDSDMPIGVEALARWTHPLLGPIPPIEFIPMAEEARLITPLTEWAVATAAADWAVWRTQGVELNVAVNVSARSLDQPEFPDTIAALCRDRGMPLDALTIELTESATTSVVDLLDALTRFRIKGAGISLDDFGTGYSSLTQLQQLPFSDLKIDRSFVANADTSRDSRVIVKAIVDLAHNLDLGVIAEGVETEPVRQLLIDCGCDVAQGYYFAKPMPAADIAGWAHAREVRPVAGPILARAGGAYQKRIQRT